MRCFWTLLCIVFLFPVQSPAARFVVTVPKEIAEVRLLSPGTQAVVEFLKKRLDEQLKASRKKNRVDQIEQEVNQASIAVTRADKAYSDKVDSLRKLYIARIPITIHSASNQITQESALGDITFFYTAQNNSDKIISDIMYKPVIGDIVLPITTSLVLEFINPKNLVFGLAPGESLSNQGSEPERFSFFLSELKEHDVDRIRSSMPGGFSIQITDVHFVSAKGYKGQSKVMDIKEAFPGVLGAYRSASQTAREEHKAKLDALDRAKTLSMTETRESMTEFRAKAFDLKKSSVRYKGPVDMKKNRATIDSIEPGAYILYAPAANGRAVFQEVTIEEGTNKAKIQTLAKDPFEP